MFTSVSLPVKKHFIHWDFAFIFGTEFLTVDCKTKKELILLQVKITVILLKGKTVCREVQRYSVLSTSNSQACFSHHNINWKRGILPAGDCISFINCFFFGCITTLLVFSVAEHKSKINYFNTNTNTKLWGVIDTPEGFAAIHKELKRLEKWADRNFVQFSKRKCKVLHLGWNNPTHLYLLSGKAAWQKRSWASWQTQSWLWPRKVPLWQRRLIVFWAVRGEVLPVGTGT